MNEKQVLIVAKDQFALKRLSDEAMRAILPAYTQSINRIIEELRNLPEDSLTREMWLKSQLTTMERQLSQVSEQVLRVLPPKQVEAFEEGLKNAEQYLVAGGIEPPVPQQQLVGATVGGQTVTQPVNLPGLGISADGSFIQPSITRQQVLAAAQDRGFKEFLTGETGANRKGYSLQELVKVNDKKAVDNIAAIMREGFLTGRSNEEIARRVGDAFGGRTKGQAVAMTNAVVRTGMAEASQAAHEMFYDANKDLLPKVPGGYRWEWDASNDTRLCEECAPLDGLRFKERDDAPAWPAHWSCRCKIVPITATEAQMREDGDVPEGSFLERQEVTYTDGKRNPPPSGYEPVKRGGTAYSRPQKQNGKMYWVRRVDMGKGKVYAGDMLKKMGRSGNFDSQRAILGNRATVERFNALTKPGAKYANDPQAAVRLLLSGNSSPPPGSIKPFFSGKPKPKPLTVKAKAKPKPSSKPKPVAKAAMPTQATKPAAPVTKKSATNRTTTPDIDQPYNQNDFTEFGYKTDVDMGNAIYDVSAWTGNDSGGYKQIVPAQLTKKKASQLTAWEKGARAQAIKNFSPEKLEALQKTADVIEDFVDKAPKYDGVIKRGIRLNTVEDAKVLINHMAEGNPSATLQSWTSEVSIAQEFARKGSGKSGIILNVQNKNGAPIASLSEFAEWEVLVPSNQQYKVLKVTEGTATNTSGQPITLFEVDLEIID